MKCYKTGCAFRNSNTSFSKGPSLFRLISLIPCFKIFSLPSELHFKIQVNYIPIVLMVQNTLQHLLRFWSPGDNQDYNFEFIKFQPNAHRFDIWVSMWNLKIGKCFISLRAYDILKITRAPHCYLDVSSLWDCWFRNPRLHYPQIIRLVNCLFSLKLVVVREGGGAKVKAFVGNTTKHVHKKIFHI
jgi:hypothetical protein